MKPTKPEHCCICVFDRLSFGPTYAVCNRCGHCQSLVPWKRFDHEDEPWEVSEADKSVNAQLAAILFESWAKPAFERRASSLRPEKAPKKPLYFDIGSRNPVLACAMAKLGARAEALDVDRRVLSEVMSYEDVDIRGHVGDFENSLDEVVSEAVSEWIAIDLVSMVHVFDHLSDPERALHLLRAFCHDQSAVFLRLVDADDGGAVRYFTEREAAVRPHLFTIDSFLWLLNTVNEKGPFFEVAQTYVLHGAGQRDIVLRPIAHRPQIHVGMIVKNEERDLPVCLASLKDVADTLTIVDTGSTDKTKEVAYAGSTALQVDLSFDEYLGASEQDENGEWKLWHFAKARNQYLQAIEVVHGAKETSRVLWMDADDEVQTPELLSNLRWLDDVSCAVHMTTKGLTTGAWNHHRLWTAGKGVVYEGAVHEYPQLRNPQIFHRVHIAHNNEGNANQENGSLRNLRILERAFAEEPTPRHAFYLAHTLKDLARWTEAAEMYGRRIALGEGFRDELLFAYLHKGRCERAAKLYEQAFRTLLRGAAEEPTWSEFWMELAYLQWDRNCTKDSLAFALFAVDRPIPPTSLWREPEMYRDQPSRRVSWAYRVLNFPEMALAWALHAQRYIVGPDTEWDEHIAFCRAEIKKRQTALLGPPRVVNLGEKRAARDKNKAARKARRK